MTENKQPLNESERSKLFHTLNNQLCLIWGYVQLLEKDETLSPKQREWIGKMNQSCQEMTEELKQMRG